MKIHLLSVDCFATEVAVLRMHLQIITVAVLYSFQSRQRFPLLVSSSENYFLERHEEVSLKESVQHGIDD